MKIKKWVACVQGRGKWKEVVEKAKTFNQEVQRLEEEEKIEAIVMGKSCNVFFSLSVNISQHARTVQLPVPLSTNERRNLKDNSVIPINISSDVTWSQNI